MVYRRNCGVALRNLRGKIRPSSGTEKTVSVRGRSGRRSARKRKRRRRKEKKRRNGSGRESGSVRRKGTGRGRGSETARGIGDPAGATRTAATPAARRIGNGADRVIAGDQGAEIRTGNASVAGMLQVLELCT